MVLNQRFYSIGHHAIEPPHPVIAGDPDLSAPAQVGGPCPGEQGGHFPGGIVNQRADAGAGKNAQLAPVERETQGCRDNLVLA